MPSEREKEIAIFAEIKLSKSSIVPQTSSGGRSEPPRQESYTGERGFW